MHDNAFKIEGVSSNINRSRYENSTDRFNKSIELKLGDELNDIHESLNHTRYHE